MINIEKLCKSYATNGATSTIFEDFNLQVNAGECVAVCGPSGSGKSTLLSILSGLDKPTSGTVSILSTPFHELSYDQKSAFRASRIGVLFQSIILIPYLTLRENIALPFTYQKQTPPWHRIEEELAAMELLDCIQRYPNDLSIGQQQRFCLVRALATEPNILLADEPTSSLDPPNSAYIFDRLNTWSKATANRSVILATHDWHLAKTCDRTIWLGHSGEELLT